MQGDTLYCIGCGKYFTDTEELYDSRNGGKPLYVAPKKVHFVWNCPHCFSNSIVNVNQTIIEELEVIDHKENNYKGTPLYKRFIKDWPKLYSFYYETLQKAKESL